MTVLVVGVMAEAREREFFFVWVWFVAGDGGVGVWACGEDM